MAQPASSSSLRLAKSLFSPALRSSSPRRLSVVPASSPAVPALVRHASRAPSLADVGSSHAPTFEQRQKEFRDRQAALKQKADRESPAQSPPSHRDRAPESAASGSELAASAAQDVSSKLGLGSLSNASTEDAKDAARKQHRDGTPGKRSGSGGMLGGKGRLASLIYGTEEGREMDREIERSFSQTLARGKYVHSIVFHEVKPDKVDDYVELVGGWYPKVAADSANKVNLVGSWRTEVGDCDTFVHIWEYQKYHGYHDSLESIQHNPAFTEFDHKLKALIHSKRTSLMQEFEFWPTTPPRKLGGVFELRSYTLHPGNLLEWETHWRKGLQARREVMEGVGAWFVQIGDLNTVHHLWQFADLEERKVDRELSWGIEGWADTVHKTVPLIQKMTSRIMVPMPWSPVS